jgi:hypothetical protein
LTDETLRPNDRLIRTICKVAKFFDPARMESLGAAQEWFYGKISEYLNLIKSDIRDAH